MGQLTLFAIGITEVRDMFGASPDLADRLRVVAEDRFRVPTTARHGRGSLLNRVGPVLKRPVDPPRAPARPTGQDVEILLAGHSVPPDRLGFAWQIAMAWLDDLSWGRTDLDADARTMSSIEFDLATAGLPSRLSIERLMQGSPQLPLPTMTGQVFGYAKHEQAEATRQALTAVIGDVGQASAPFAGAVLEFLNHYPEWTIRAGDARRPDPDLVVSWFA
ncbi:hypothetical protein GCM10009785_14170 [Brooklawnia cerclae]|uniref:DUF7691 domain-containing protein n=1 Tax=Brooklawnia cerclae TaxID=349934 RepID=A0ABX0SL12_9ACTN|nr:hypothetical protein [Brooklawnia cerclae]NIH58013.1 hypothetical protein [Brooklawnia cerclae]